MPNISQLPQFPNTSAPKQALYPLEHGGITQQTGGAMLAAPFQNPYVIDGVTPAVTSLTLSCDAATGLWSDGQNLYDGIFIRNYPVAAPTFMLTLQRFTQVPTSFIVYLVSTLARTTNTIQLYPRGWTFPRGYSFLGLNASNGNASWTKFSFPAGMSYGIPM